MLTPPAALHALLFASGEPIEKKQAAKLLKITGEELVIVEKALTESLKGSGVMLVETETDLELRTIPEASEIVKQLRENELARDLGKGSLETLAVIAYQTGATRSDIDWVRGVNSSASIRTLLMRGLIEGKEDEKDKRRIRYVLTTEALAHLGISQSLDLPRAAELRAATHEVIEEKEIEAAYSPAA
ncbi:MAG: SMC-Scp complex subunit ScpB [Candidatus Paceibacteria bacterium]